MKPPITITRAPAPEPSILIADAAPTDPGLEARIHAAWHEMRAAAPRLYDGPILLVDPVTDPARLVARRGTYRALATAAAVGRCGLRALGVQGVVIGRDAGGREHLLLGRRGGDTRVYPGLWENAPAGSVRPPHRPHDRLRLADLFAALREEGVEELGLHLEHAPVRWIGLLDDPGACSLDVILEVRPTAAIDPRRALCANAEGGCTRWEYADAAWIAVTDLSAWAARHAAAVSPPTRALLGFLGLAELPA